MSRRDRERLADVEAAIDAMRDHLAHRYVDTSHAIPRATVDQDLPTLLAAVGRLVRLIDRRDTEP